MCLDNMDLGNWEQSPFLTRMNITIAAHRRHPRCKVKNY